jgi:hypothetical protein
VNYRPKIIAAILWDMGHTKERPPLEGQEKGRKSKTLMWLICSWYRNEYRNLKLARATMGRGLKRSEEDW